MRREVALELGLQLSHGEARKNRRHNASVIGWHERIDGSIHDFIGCSRGRRNLRGEGDGSEQEETRYSGRCIEKGIIGNRGSLLFLVWMAFFDRAIFISVPL